MEEAKGLQLKVVHLLLLAVGVVISVVSIVMTIGSGDDPTHVIFDVITNVTKIIALISALFYLIAGYKKNAAKYYKLYMILLLVSELLYSSFMACYGAPLTATIANLIGLILVSILATGKDLGKKNTYTASIVLIIARLVEGVIGIIYSSRFGANGINAVFFFISYMILACTTIVMITGKYNDKDARGTT